MVSRTEKNKSKRKEIDKKDREEKRKKITTNALKVIMVVTIILSVSYLILRYIGNYGLVVKEESLIYENLPDSFHGLKIVHFTDLHYGTVVDTKKLKKIVTKINSINPDLIFFTGDLVDRHYSLNNEEKQEIIKLLNELDAKLGKYATEGNHDKKYFNSIMKDTDFMILENSYDLIYKEDITPILITGIGSSTLNNMDIDKAFSYFKEVNVNQDIFTISIMHEPDNIDGMLEKYKIDLAFAGHSHNGQVRFPFTEALVKVDGAKKYYEEKYVINNTTLFISGGICTSNYPFRLFNHPSINFIRLRSK